MRAVEQRDAADEGRLEPYGSISVGRVIVSQGEVVRPSQLIASVRQTIEDREEGDIPTDAGLRNHWLTASAAILAE